MGRFGNERGIALPVTIFIVTMLTIMLAAAFARVDAERAIAVGTSDAVNAQQVAQSGLQTYMGSRTSRPTNGDSVRYNVTGGYADVRAWIVQRPADTMQNQMYVVRSTGYAIVPTAGATPQGVRTVAQFAYWQTPAIRRVGAFVAANGVRALNPGNGVRVQGEDQCGVAADITGVRGAAGSSLNFGSYSGSPATTISGSGDQVADTTGVQWATMIGGGFVPDYTSMQTGLWNWGSHMVQGNATLSSAWGTGLLVVAGDLTTAGSYAYWYGIVLVGGQIIFNSGHTHFNGIVISGLREQLTGTPPPRGDIGGVGSRQYHLDYWSCYVTNTLDRLKGFVPVRNASVDNWASY
ncbi:MAG: hypothetical protein HY337_07080 [Gemmatimonadetes bacterium]|nr:hypothetical protein [Gemmatimonadota bacterium]